MLADLREGQCAVVMEGKSMIGRTQTWQSLMVSGNDIGLKPKNHGIH